MHLLAHTIVYCLAESTVGLTAAWPSLFQSLSTNPALWLVAWSLPNHQYSAPIGPALTVDTQWWGLVSNYHHMQWQELLCSWARQCNGILSLKTVARSCNRLQIIYNLAIKTRFFVSPCQCPPASEQSVAWAEQQLYACCHKGTNSISCR